MRRVGGKIADRGHGVRGIQGLVAEQRGCAICGLIFIDEICESCSQNDAQAARAAACPVVLVTYGYNHGEPIRGVDCDGFIDSFTELKL